MEKNYIEDKSFENTDFTLNPLEKAEYENCSFHNCNFSNTDLSGIHFSDCEFTGCNLSMVTLHKTAFRDIIFKGSKLLGLHFETCDDFVISINFDNCILNFTSFYTVKIKKTTFKDCSIQEADFTEADLTKSIFKNCDLNKTKFDRTILEGVDFSSSYNYSIDPELNRIKKARFSIAGIQGLLDKYDIEIE